MPNQYSPIVNEALEGLEGSSVEDQLAAVDEALKEKFPTYYGGVDGNFGFNVKFQEARNEVFRRDKMRKNAMNRVKIKKMGLGSGQKGENYRRIIKSDNNNIMKSNPRTMELHATKGWRSYRTQDRG